MALAGDGIPVSDLEFFGGSIGRGGSVDMGGLFRDILRGARGDSVDMGSFRDKIWIRFGS